MPFEKINLPAFLISSLYKDSLVLLDKTVEHTCTQSNEPIPSKKWFLGDNKSNIIILVKDENAVYLADTILSLLTQILSACKLNLADVAIVNTINNKLDYEYLHNELKGRYYLLFDNEPSSIGLPFALPTFQIKVHEGGCSFLLSPSLEEMLDSSENAKMNKTKLWVCLKQLFNV